MGILGAILSLAFFLAAIALFVISATVYHDWGTPRILLITFGVVAFALGIIFAVYAKRMDGSTNTKNENTTNKNTKTEKIDIQKTEGERKPDK